MTKGEARKARKESRKSDRSWSVELSEDGGNAVVRERTQAEERQHRNGWDRWAERCADRD